MSGNENKGRLCAVPFTRDKKRIESFNVVGPKPFTIIPKELRNMKCPLSDFKIGLDAFLMNVPDEPPWPGAWSNRHDPVETQQLTNTPGPWGLERKTAVWME